MCLPVDTITACFFSLLYAGVESMCVLKPAHESPIYWSGQRQA